MSPGRGGGPKIKEWYVYDTVRKCPVTTTCCVEEHAQETCDLWNKLDADKEFEKEVLDGDA